MSESKQKVIERNRAPRVQIAYDVEHYGSPTTIELPFVMGVMADLAGQSETAEAKKPVGERNFVETDARPQSRQQQSQEKHPPPNHPASPHRSIHPVSTPRGWRRE